MAKIDRRFLSCSLRSFLGLTIIVGAWFGWLSQQARKQRVAIQWIREHGGRVLYEDEYARGDNQTLVELQPHQQPSWKWIPLPAAWKTGFVRDMEWNVVFAELEPDSSDLSPIVGLGHLRELRAVRCKTSDISPLMGLSRLEILRLDGSRLIDVGPLSELSTLEIVSLNDTDVSDVRPLANLPRLRRLFLSRTLVEDFSYLAACERLELLWADSLSARQSAQLQAALPNCEQISVPWDAFDTKSIERYYH